MIKWVLCHFSSWLVYSIRSRRSWFKAAWIDNSGVFETSSIWNFLPDLMLQVNIVLASGRSENLSIEQSSKVGDLKSLAQNCFCPRSFTFACRRRRALLDLSQSLQDAGSKRETPWRPSHEKQRSLPPTGPSPFGASERTASSPGGSPDCGGNSSPARGLLRNLQEIRGNESAFAALGDGSVVTWGEEEGGGDSSLVQDQLRGVLQIQATNSAFAAILDDGSVVAWGHAGNGGDSSAVKGQLRNVQQVQATVRAFAAVLADGSVVTWGNAGYGGDSSAIQDRLRNVQQIQATQRAFAAILSDGSVVTLGRSRFWWW